MTVEWEIHTYSDRYTDDKQPMYTSDATDTKQEDNANGRRL